MKRTVLTTLVTLALALLGGVGTGRASAQETPAGTMVIEFPAAATLYPPSAPRDLLSGSVTAFAGGVFCATFDFADGERFVIGEPGQPAVCHAPGARIEFVNGRGLMVTLIMEFQPGTTQVFDNFGRVPPDWAYPAYVCNFLESVDIESVDCEASAAREVAPPIAGSAGLAGSGAASGAGALAGFTLATLLMVAARRSTAPGSRRSSGTARGSGSS